MSGEYELRLYVLGSTPSSTRAVANLRAVVDEHLGGRASLEVIDVYEHPERAAQDQVLAVPTLVRGRPTPVRRLLGDLSDRPKVLAALDVPVLDQP
jgi:circadian clock protein KaiB